MFHYYLMGWWLKILKTVLYLMFSDVKQTQNSKVTLLEQKYASHIDDMMGKLYEPCMNSKSLLTTVFRNLQWARKKRGYWPTTYIMLDAMIALLSLPRFCSHRPSKSYKHHMYTQWYCSDCHSKNESLMKRMNTSSCLCPNLTSTLSF